MRKRLIRSAIVTAAVIGLSVPGVVAANSGSIDTTGPDSDNTITYNTDHDVDVNNTNTLSASVYNDQNAESGDAKVKHNTTGGDATSGDAENDASFDASVDIDNSSCGCGSMDSWDNDFDGSIENTGPDSDNHITVNTSHNVSVNNTNTVSVSQNVTQNARSGDARVEDNTTGGDATSGNASNSSSTSFSFSFSN